MFERFGEGRNALEEAQPTISSLCRMCKKARKQENKEILHEAVELIEDLATALEDRDMALERYRNGQEVNW